MATRAFARMTTDFHDEPSIRNLTSDQQWAYDVVYKRPDLSRCGVVAYTPRRWAKYAKGMTETKLRRLYDQLAATRHVVLDDDSEELLIRTYVRHDGLLTQPNVVSAMVGDYRLIASPIIRTAFLIEMRRIWDLDFGPEVDHKVRGGWLLAMGHYPRATEDKDIRFPDGMSAKSLAPLKRNIGTGLSADLREAIQQGSVEPFDEGSEKGSPQPFQEGSSRARPHGPSPSPATAPTPAPTPSAAATPATAGDRSGSNRNHLLELHQADLGPLPTITAQALAKHLHAAPAEATDTQLLAALETWRRKPDAKPGLLPHLIGDQLRTSPDPDALTPDELAYIQAQTAARAAGGAR